MADPNLILTVAGHDVDSTITTEINASDYSLVRVESICEGHTHRAVITIAHGTGYTQAQAEYDIEQARWNSAQAAAGKAHIRSLLPAIVQPQSANATPRRLSAPEHPKPTTDT